MPKLKQITCSLELAPNDVKLKEYDQRFRDGAVECFVAVPEASIPFSIHMHTHGWIASGMAMFVFIDGVYHCNRNKRCPGVPGVSDKQDYDIDFRVRQREDKMADSSFIGREWMFQALKLAEADRSPTMKPTQERDIGTIEVVVLRCNYESKTENSRRQATVAAPTKAQSVAKPLSVAKAASARASSAGFGGMMGLFDGAGDEPPEMPTMMEFDPILGVFVPGSVIRSHRDDRSAIYEKYGEGRVQTVNNTPADCKQPNSGLVLDGQGFYGQSGPPPFSFRPHYGARAPLQSMHYGNADPRYQDLLNKGASLPPQPGYPHSPTPFVTQQPQGYPQHLRRAGHQPIQIAAAYERGGIPGQRHIEDPFQQSHYPVPELHRPREARHEDQAPLLEPALYNPGMPGLPPYFRADMVEGVAPFVVMPGQPMSMDVDPEYQLFLISKMPSGMLAEYRIDRAQFAAGARYIRCLHHIKLTDVHRLQFPHIRGMLECFQARRSYPDGSPVVQMSDSAPKSGHRSGGAQNSLVDGLWAALDPHAKAPASNAAANGPSAPAPSAAGGKSNSGTQEHNFATSSKKDDNGGWADAPAADAKPSGDWGAQPVNPGAAPTWGGDADQNTGAQDNANGDANAWASGDDKKASDSGDAGGWGADNSAQKAESKKGDGWGPGTQHDGQSARSERSMKTTKTYDPRSHIKPYWAGWQQPQALAQHDQNPGTRRETAREVYHYPAPPVPTVSANDKRDASHGVHVGRGVEYVHKTYRPAYIDTMEEPYAVFTFKYRSRERLEQILRRSITAECGRVEEEVQKGALLAMPKEELVKQLMAMKSPSSAHRTASKAPSVQQGWGGGSAKGDAAPAANNDWGKPKKSGTSQSGDNGGGWGSTSNKGDAKPASANGGGWNDTSAQKPASSHSKTAATGWKETGAGQTGGGGWGAAEAPAGSAKGFKAEEPVAVAPNMW